MQLSTVFCIHCGRVYVFSDAVGREDCVCGAELHPVFKTLVLGQELQLADGWKVRASLMSGETMEAKDHEDVD